MVFTSDGQERSNAVVHLSLYFECWHVIHAHNFRGTKGCHLMALIVLADTTQASISWLPRLHSATTAARVANSKVADPFCDFAQQKPGGSPLNF